jgi:hypothetical protein
LSRKFCKGLFPSNRGILSLGKSLLDLFSFAKVEVRLLFKSLFKDCLGFSTEEEEETKRDLRCKSLSLGGFKNEIA